MSETNCVSSSSTSTSTYSHSTFVVKDRNGNSKFIGGAAMQRRNVRKNIRRKNATRILRPDQVLKSKEALSVKLSPFERYFAGLLRSEANDFVQRKDYDVWTEICQRLALPVPSSPLPAYYSTQEAHFSNRASLVMEESRYAITDSLKRLERKYRESNQLLQPNYKTKPDTSMDLNPDTGEFLIQQDQTMVSMELVIRSVEHQRNTGHTILTFSKDYEPFTRAEKQALRNGTIFACLNRRLASTISNIVLGVIMPQSREDIEQTSTFTVMVFKLIKNTTGERWNVTSITSLLSDQRKYDACMEQMKNPVPFIFPLLGGKQPTHLRFHEHDDNVQTNRVVKSEHHDGTVCVDSSSSDESSSDESSSENSSIAIIEVIDCVDSECSQVETVLDHAGTSCSVQDCDNVGVSQFEVCDTVEPNGDLLVPETLDSNSDVEVLENVDSDSDVEVLEIIDVDATFQLPLLNYSQEAAAKAFLSSKPREITLIQG
jgi:hypothetical protein